MTQHFPVPVVLTKSVKTHMASTAVMALTAEAAAKAHYPKR